MLSLFFYKGSRYDGRGDWAAHLGMCPWATLLPCCLTSISYKNLSSHTKKLLFNKKNPSLNGHDHSAVKQNPVSMYKALIMILGSTIMPETEV